MRQTPKSAHRARLQPLLLPILRTAAPVALAALLGGCTGLPMSVPVISELTFPGGVSADVLSPNKTLFDRAIEARSSGDIVDDTILVLDANALMADAGTIGLSTEVYEQRLLVLGELDDPELADELRQQIAGLDGLRELYWHVQVVPPQQYAADFRDDDGEAGAGDGRQVVSDVPPEQDEGLDWVDRGALDARVGLALVAWMAVADVNYRVAVDRSANVYLLGLARSEEERQIALAAVREVEGVREVIDYLEVRPNMRLSRDTPELPGGPGPGYGR